MSARQDQHRTRLECQQLEPREIPSVTPWVSESFDRTVVGSSPASWVQWSNQSPGAFAAQNVHAFDGPNGLGSNGTSALEARSWYSQVMQADFGSSAYVYLDSLQPLQLLVRGSNLNTPTATYYALSVARGLQADLVKVVNGTTTGLATLKSTSYLSGMWVQVSLKPTGNTLSAEIYRPDTKQYLNSAGNWQSAETAALTATDASIAGNGCAGVDRPARFAGAVNLDEFSIFGPGARDDFDSTPVNTVPSGWAQWSNSGGPTFAVENQAASSPTKGFASNSSSSQVDSRAWVDTSLPPDLQVSASVNLAGLVPGRLFARARNVNTATPTYYAVQITRGLEVDLLRIVNGTTTVLRTLKSSSYFSNQWVKVTLGVSGSHLYAQVYRTDIGQYLNSTGAWQNAPTRALDLTDGTITAGGVAGLERPALYAGAVSFDDFVAVAASGDIDGPVVTISSPTTGATLSGTVAVQATATDAAGIDHVEFYVDGVLRYATAQTPYAWSFSTNGLTNGLHALTVKAYDPLGNVGQATVTCTVNNNAIPLPSFPQHYSQIRIAELAYSGTPITSFEQNLLTNSVDLVIPNASYLSQINAVAPTTPQLIYTNVSNIYQNLLTDWLTYADQHGLTREDAFYHVAAATPFTGNSASSQPVKWFWSVRRGASLTSLTDLTSAAHGSAANDVAFGALNESLYVGYTEKFREINVNLAAAAAGGWKSVLEYATATDANGNPTGWKTLPLLSDGTAGFAHSGQIAFDPPADWKSAAVRGSALLYYIRVRTVSAGSAPVAISILGRDYVNANGTTSGVIPAFDSSADANHDGYLNDAEYAKRKPGFDARFSYESRLFYPSYGQMRFVVNPGNVDVHQWAADFEYRFLHANPLADGVFVDNSNGKLPISGIATVESTANYSSAYGALLGAISQRIAPKWIAANTAGGNATDTSAVIQNSAGSFQESGL
ncbi:MAG: Ig-like domain-containing protein, partial [Gemmataceae bacterium]